ncbi:sugar transferase [Rhodoferax sp.]|uniref:sugar transferase n=1 Tax=Rhodoferax sp. TaxID=50421 RepID=UPI0025F8A1A7|nr:sugar transferase [Rhodoferax sp.]MCM2340142.1 sugar transferase [Rhodoferax sp.]
MVELRTKAGVHELLPGLTGWTQINGQDALPIPEKVVLDVVYFHRQLIFFDVKIIFLTTWRVIKRDNMTH